MLLATEIAANNAHPYVMHGVISRKCENSHKEKKNLDSANTSSSDVNVAFMWNEKNYAINR